MHGTLPSSDNTLTIQPNQLEGLVPKVVSSPRLIPLSPNYFDALSKMEEDVPREERAQRTEPTNLNWDPKEKAPMPLAQQEREGEEEALRRALQLSRVKAQWTSLVRTRRELRII